MRMNSRDVMISGNNPDVVKNTIYFSRKKNKNGVFLLVEGTSDVGFYKEIIDKKSVNIIPIGEDKSGIVSAKDRVISTIKNLNSSNISGVLAIVDTDYDEIMGNKQDIDNLIYTDGHDIETMILESGVYDKFENEYGNEKNIDAYEENCGKIFDNILNYGCEIGKIRLLSIKSNLSLDFKTINLEEFFNESLQFDYDNYLKQILYASKKLQMRESLKDILKKDDQKYNIWQLCRGHDLSELIVVFYSEKSRFKLGNKKARYLKAETVEQFLRAAYYAPVFFKKTKMFTSMQEWQTENKEWRLLNGKFVQAIA